jgi:hypothetical protein
MKPLYKTTIVIWSEFDPKLIELDDLAREAMRGEAYCSKSDSNYLKDPGADPDWDNTEFFLDPYEKDVPPDNYEEVY